MTDSLSILQECDYTVQMVAYREPLDMDKEDKCKGYPYCVATYPHRVITPKSQSHYFFYSIQHDKNKVIVEKFSLNEDGSSEKLGSQEYNVPIYAMRIFVVTHFLICCQNYQYAKDLVVYISIPESNGEELYFETVDEFYGQMFAPDSAEDLGLEEKILELFAKTYNVSFSDEYDTVAKELGIIDGYAMLRYLLKEML
jgi:hypothetical protein